MEKKKEKKRKKKKKLTKNVKGYMNDVYCFDTVSRKWKKLECGNAPSRRYGHSVVEVNGDILVFGGFDDFGLRCNDMWSFKVSTCEWTPMLHLQSEAPEALHHSAAICQGSMLVWGGMDASSDVHEYRLGSRSWSVVKIRATLTPRPKWGHRLFARAGELYLLGGTDALMGHSSVWKFSYASCQWTLLGESDLLSGRFFFSMVVWGSKVVCFGGKNSHNYAFDDVIVWSYRAEQEEAVSSYRDDFAKMMASAGPDVSGCIKIDCLHEAFFCHDFILRARLPVVLQTKRVAADGETIRALLFLAYTGELSAGLSDQGMLMRLAQLCRELGSPSWMWQCIELELASLVSVENVLSLFKWVISNQKKLEMGRLASACIKLLVGSFEALRSSIKDQLNYEWYNAVKQSWRKANEKK
jgi:hypothetical protein